MTAVVLPAMAARVRMFDGRVRAAPALDRAGPGSAATVAVMCDPTRARVRRKVTSARLHRVLGTRRPERRRPSPARDHSLALDTAPPTTAARVPAGSRAAPREGCDRAPPLA